MCCFVPQQFGSWGGGFCQVTCTPPQVDLTSWFPCRWIISQNDVEIHNIQHQHAFRTLHFAWGANSGCCLFHLFLSKASHVMHHSIADLWESIQVLIDSWNLVEVTTLIGHIATYTHVSYKLGPKATSHTHSSWHAQCCHSSWHVHSRLTSEKKQAKHVCGPWKKWSKWCQ
jgi:hypothetical protein